MLVKVRTPAQISCGGATAWKPLAASPWAARAGGLRLKWAEGRSGSKIGEKVKVLRISLPIVESLSGLQEYFELI